MSACTKPLNHDGRCRGADGSTWENNHPTTQREQDAVAQAAAAMVERDQAVDALNALRRTVTVIDDLATVCTLAALTEHRTDAETAALTRITQLLGGTL